MKDPGVCVCDPGWEGDGSVWCDNIDECVLDHACSARATCTDTPGSYTCECEPGCSGDGNQCECWGWLDPDTGLLWDDEVPVGNTMNWYRATNYCEEMEKGGYKDWHVANIEQLRTLVHECPSSEPGGSCGVNSSSILAERGADCDGCGIRDPGTNGYLVKHLKTLTRSYAMYLSNDKVGDDSSLGWLINYMDGSISTVRIDQAWGIRCVRQFPLLK